MSHINIKIKPQKTAVSSVSFGAQPQVSLAQITNVDASDPKDNDVLVYEEGSGKYVVKTLPVVQGGKF
jgi:hypothetical protein